MTPSSTPSPTPSPYDMVSGTAPGLPPLMPGRLVLNGENPFIRLTETEGAPFSTDASLWTINWSPRGAGRALFIQSELTQGRWRIYSDNAPMVRWLQATVQGMLNPATADSAIAIVRASFTQEGNLQSRWTQSVHAEGDEIVLTWSDLLPPLTMAHPQPSQPPDRNYGANVVMMPARRAELTMNGRTAAGQPWPCRYDGQPFSTAALAFSESWREAE